jgi:methionyl-tRNA formyltransferase
MAKIVFMGTPDFSVPILQRLIEEHEVIGVVTQPDRPAGRSRQIQPSPVKQAALAAGILVFQPEKLRRPEAIEELKRWSPEIYVVAAFGQILPQTVLDIPPHGSLNVHASLLPRWRGAAPIQAAIRAGDRETGVTIMKMDAGVDTGPILTRWAVAIEPDETGQSLHDKLALLGAGLLISTLPHYLNGEIIPQIQDDSYATLAPRLEKEAGRIDWTQDAAAIERTVRAFTPWPGTFTFWDGKQLKIHSGRITPPPDPLPIHGEGEKRIEPGLVVERNGKVAIGTGKGLFYPTQVQMEGRSKVTIEEFVRGYGGFFGARLG